MAYTIAFFGTKPYDETSFNEKNKEFGYEIRYFKGHLNKNNVLLTQGVDAVCIFVNDTADAEVIRTLAEQKTTMIIVTHEMAFARDVADQLIFMDGGVIVEQGDPHQVIDHPKEERTKQFLTRYAQG